MTHISSRRLVHAPVRHAFLLSFLRLSPALLVAGLAAQSPERVPITSAEPDAVTRSQNETPRHNTFIEAIVGPTHTDIGDEPDFTPTKRISEGYVDLTSDIIGDPYVLSFLGGDFKPEPGIDTRLLQAMAIDPSGHTFGYIMVQGRLNHPAKIAQIEALGVKILAPHTWQSFAARIPFHALPRLSALPYVRWVGYAKLDQKIDPQLAPALATAKPIERFQVHVSTFVSDINPASVQLPLGDLGAEAAAAGVRDLPVVTVIPNGRFHRNLVALGLQFQHYINTENVHVFVGMATANDILRMTELDFVSYIEPAQRHTLLHDQSQRMISADRVRGTYHGEPITVGIIDSGFDISPRHVDFGGKDLVGWRTGGTTAFNDDCTHGTHVAGTMFGRGVADARYKGTAPNCGNGGPGGRVFVGRYFFDSCEPLGDVTTLYAAMSRDYVEGAITNPRPRCINNSWGAPSGSLWSGTESGARALDDIIQTHSQNYIFSSGNSGLGTGSPGSAKNALTVGSIDDFGTNTGRITSFSRSGVSDGRQKPEVMAPGNDIASTTANTTSGYSNKAGTSMAAPHVTGALTGLIQHYGFLDYRPSAQQIVAIASSEVQGQTARTATQGWGCINAYKMHWASKTGWSIVTNTTAITATGNWFYIDIAVPANIMGLDVIWGWTEPAASSGATVARRSNIRVSLDAPPYTATGNTGEYTAFLGSNNKWKTANLNLATFAGQTVRMKLYGDSVSGSCHVSAMLFWHYQDSETPNPTLSIASSTPRVRPNTLFTMTGRWLASSTGDEFDNGRIRPVLPTGFVATQLETTSADNIVQTYTGSTHPSSPWPSLTGNGITVGQGTSRQAIWTLRSPASNGNFTLRVEGQADYRTSASTFATTPICVDGQNPNLPTGLSSSTHTVRAWSSNPAITFNWTPPTDVGCAGLAGQRVDLGNSSCPTPATSVAAAVNTRTYNRLSSTTSGNGYFFAVRGIDNVDNLGGSACVGPYLIDTVNPSVSSVSINSGATYTTGLSVSVAVSATDAHSGVIEVRLSSNNSTWSPWQPFVSPINYTLSSNGGNSNEGVKTVYVQVRDRAGNGSTSGSDTIEYLRLPAITSSAPTTLPNVTEGFFRLTGTDFVGVQEVRFGATSITSTSANNWHAGYFRVINDSTLDVYPPQAQPTGAIGVRLRNAAGLSNVQNVTLAFPTSAVLRTHSTLTAGRPQTIFTSSGPSTGAFVSYLCLSPSNLPSSFPGLVSLEIGNGFSSLTFLSIAFPHNAATRSATIGPFNTVPTMIGANLYFEALTFLAPALPLPTTDSWRTVYN